MHGQTRWTSTSPYQYKPLTTQDVRDARHQVCGEVKGSKCAFLKVKTYQDYNTRDGNANVHLKTILI